MKEALEEYGGAFVACLIGISLVTLFNILLSGDSNGAGGTIRDMIIQFFTSLGGKAI